MKNLLFYSLTVLIWGSTWFAIKLQLGEADPMVSVAYRFSLAAGLLLLWCRLRGLSLRFTRTEHLFLAMQGLFLFSSNYLLFYLAELHVTSGLAAVIFSTILIMNMINGVLFLGSPLDPRVLIGGGLGLAGIFLVFRPEITSFSLSTGSFRGFLFCVVATYLASLGNIISARNQRSRMPLVQSNAFGMAYGALIMLLLAAFSGKSFVLPIHVTYLGSLFYLAVFGTIIAFGCYLTLIGNIGADRAAYATLLFPIVALFISTFLEGYSWSTPAIWGVALILTGNLLLLKKRTGRPKPVAPSQPQQDLKKSLLSDNQSATTKC